MGTNGEELIALKVGPVISERNKIKQINRRTTLALQNYKGGKHLRGATSGGRTMEECLDNRRRKEVGEKRELPREGIDCFKKRGHTCS